MADVLSRIAIQMLSTKTYPTETFLRLIPAPTFAELCVILCMVHSPMAMDIPYGVSFTPSYHLQVGSPKYVVEQGSCEESTFHYLRGPWCRY